MRITKVLPYFAATTTAVLLLLADANGACVENTTSYEMKIWFSPDNKGEMINVPVGGKACDDDYEGTVNAAIMDAQPPLMASIKVSKDGYIKVIDGYLVAFDENDNETMKVRLGQPR
ncbi:MAG: hypothetical protein AB8I58_13605 [Anaerolineales bacterium]